MIAQLEKTKQKLTHKLPIMVAGYKGFSPTALQIQVLCKVLQLNAINDDTKPYLILEEMGKSNSNWYEWVKRADFCEWWHAAHVEYHSKTGLAGMYNAVQRRGLANSSQDAKLYLERFDKQYKPQTTTENTFKGFAPPDERKQIEAIETSRRMIAGEVEPARAIAGHTSDDTIDPNSSDSTDTLTTEQAVTLPADDDIQYNDEQLTAPAPPAVALQPRPINNEQLTFNNQQANSVTVLEGLSDTTSIKAENEPPPPPLPDWMK